MKRSLIAIGAVMLASASTTAFGIPAFGAEAPRDEQWHLEFLNIAEAHRISTGKGVTVAVVDSGVSSHPDIDGSVLKGTDFVKPGADGRTDRSGHGTKMAGLIAAHGEGRSSTLGIAPDAQILPIRVLDIKRRNAEVGPAIKYAISHGAKVINLSMGGSINPETMNAVKAAEEEDVVIVASAGNKPDDFTVIAPAFLESIVAVGAIDETGKKAAISVSGAALDLMAPGEKVAGPWIRGGYNVGSGTSDSAAIVSGAAALIRSKYPNMSATEVVERLQSTAVDKGPPGVDPDYGHGIIDIVAALSEGAAGTAPSAPPTSAAVPVPTTTTSAVSPETEPASSNTPLIAGAAAILAGLAAFLILRRRANPSP